MERDFELAPAPARAVLETAQQVLLTSWGSGEVREGQMRVTVVSADEPSGKPLSEIRTGDDWVTPQGHILSS
jgi:hypothetical protein